MQLDSLQRYLTLKQKRDFIAVDTHFHPFDVMGVLPPDAHCENKNEKELDDSPGLLERFHYDRIAKWGTALAFALAPKFIEQTIRSTYDSFSEKTLEREMALAGIDRVCMLPIEPWATTERIAHSYAHKQNYYVLGSIDIHRVSASDVPNILSTFKKKYGIVGLKLHPNLQGFHPLPSRNEKSVGETLHVLYREAERHQLYLHFHSGASFYTKRVHETFPHTPRATRNALLENFFNPNDEAQELLGQYDTPIIVAHAASYGISDFNDSTVLNAISLHKKFFFDTSGVSPRILARLIRTVGFKHVVFGSDGPYNRIAYNVSFLMEALEESVSDTQLTEAVEAAFSTNFLRYILGES